MVPCPSTGAYASRALAEAGRCQTTPGSQGPRVPRRQSPPPHLDARPARPLLYLGTRPVAQPRGHAVHEARALGRVWGFGGSWSSAPSWDRQLHINRKPQTVGGQSRKDATRAPQARARARAAPTGVMRLASNFLTAGISSQPPASEAISRRTSASEGAGRLGLCVINPWSDQPGTCGAGGLRGVWRPRCTTQCRPPKPCLVPPFVTRPAGQTSVPQKTRPPAHRRAPRCRRRGPRGSGACAADSSWRAEQRRQRRPAPEGEGLRVCCSSGRCNGCGRVDGAGPLVLRV